MNHSTLDQDLIRAKAKIRILFLFILMLLIVAGFFVFKWVQIRNSTMWAVQSTEQIPRDLADKWAKLYIPAGYTKTKSVSFDIEKLWSTIGNWRGMEIGGNKVNQVNAELIIYDAEIEKPEFGLDPKKKNGVLSICLSPYNKEKGINVYNQSVIKSYPLNLGDLHP